MQRFLRASFRTNTLEARGGSGKPFTPSLELTYRAGTQAGRKGSMTDTIALYLGLVILAALGLDIFFNDTQALIFLVQKLVGYIEYVAFWR
jgi:hypothetical protein